MKLIRARDHRKTFSRSPVTSVAIFATPSHIRRALWYETCELAIERLGYTGAPALRDGHGREVGIFPIALRQEK
jgi:hypothetical protein